MDRWAFSGGGGAPDVTVVVNVYDNAEITARCLNALHSSEEWNLTRFEVLVVDDASPQPEVTELLGRARGVRSIHLEVNQGFLRAANAGLAAARGKHAVLLNNDTLVQGTWLDPLVDSLRRHPAAGVVGSRLVYPDGRVQEAGGIIFSDASGWNYCRQGQFDDPRVAFPRQVDYCSGACLLISGSLLAEVGGFDERFAPAYYEDTDLCFTARALGYEVWYEPTSIVVHVEGASHGTDESSGLKEHQRINARVFARKWAKTLAQQAPPGADSVAAARWRTQRGKVIYIDQEVPTPDRDSGSRRATAIMDLMTQLGFGVTFCPSNGLRRPRYTEALQRRGIQVLGSPDAWWDELEAMGPAVRAVWIARPPVGARYLQRAREAFPGARIIYDTVDLHFLRERRQAATAGDRALAAAAENTRSLELALMDAADATVVVSPVEAEVLVASGVGPVTILPNLHAPGPATAPTGRDGLLFVGSFRHDPNVDAVLWFVREVLPSIRSAHPGTTLRLVGPDAPPEVLALAAVPGVEVLGWVPELAEVYGRTRVVVAPLRFGAGVKGKVGEAMECGVPVVATGCAAEGMGLVDGTTARIADDPDEFALAVGELLADDARWLAIARAAQEHVGREFAPAAHGESLLQLLTQDG